MKCHDITSRNLRLMLIFFILGFNKEKTVPRSGAPLNLQFSIYLQPYFGKFFYTTFVKGVASYFGTIRDRKSVKTDLESSKKIRVSAHSLEPTKSC